MVQEIDCPQCGCNEVEHLETRQWWGRPIMLMKCDHCHRRFQHEMPIANEVDTAEAFYPIVSCAACGGRMKVARKQANSSIREMKCSNCDRTCKLQGKEFSV